MVILSKDEKFPKSLGLVVAIMGVTGGSTGKLLNGVVVVVDGGGVGTVSSKLAKDNAAVVDTGAVSKFAKSFTTAAAAADAGGGGCCCGRL